MERVDGLSQLHGFSWHGPGHEPGLYWRLELPSLPTAGLITSLWLAEGTQLPTGPKSPSTNTMSTLGLCKGHFLLSIIGAKYSIFDALEPPGLVLSYQNAALATQLHGLLS